MGLLLNWLEPTAHNGLVSGSSPDGPTNQINDLEIYCGGVCSSLNLTHDSGAFREVQNLRDIVGAIDATHLDPAAFRTLENVLAGTFGFGGAATVSGMPSLPNPSVRSRMRHANAG